MLGILNWYRSAWCETIASHLPTKFVFLGAVDEYGMVFIDFLVRNIEICAKVQIMYPMHLYSHLRWRRYVQPQHQNLCKAGRVCDETP